LWNGRASSMEGPAEDVLRFIADRIETVPHLESLLLLWEARPRAFTAADLAQRIFVSKETAAQILNDLKQRKLVATAADPSQFSYDSHWDPAGDFIARVAATYRRHLIPVATFIHSKASPSVREFARAFEPKKER
jgi:hypothetical protein